MGRKRDWTRGPSGRLAGLLGCLLAAGFLAGCGSLDMDLGLEPPPAVEGGIAAPYGEPSDSEPVLAEAPREQPDPGQDRPVESRPMVRYEVELNGVSGADALRDLMTDNGLLYRLRDDPPASLLALRRRLDADLETFREILRSQGYYGGTVEGRIDRESEPVRVAVDVTPGTRYSIAAFDVRYVEGIVPPGAPTSIADVDLEQGAPADADAVLEQVSDLPPRLQAMGYPFAKVENTRYLVNHDERAMRAEVAMRTGPPARFGPVRVQGLEDVEEEYLIRLAPWRAGETWNEEKVEAYRAALLGTGLFRSLRMGHPEEVGADGTLPVEVEAAEAKHRTIGAGLRYSSDTGIGAKAYWEHRNYFGEDEDLRIALTLSALQQEFTTDFLKPNWIRPDQSLVANFTAEHEDTDAYERTGAITSVGVERQFNELWRGGARISLEFAQIQERDQDETTVALVGFPLNVVRDSTDDRLDPTEGSVLALTVTPYAGANQDQALTFARAEASASVYYSPFENDRLVLAARGATGTVAGEELQDIPADKRFYAGGGGSVRGYEYQLLGPLDQFNDPTGGRSVIEANFEARIKVTDSIGVVPFIDGGQVFEAQYPDFSEDILWAAGVGFRYYTGIGPLRLDVAVPLNAREVDDAYQFYLSLGQAF